MRLLCAAAPPKGWATGIEEIVLARATQLARGALAADGEVTSFEVSAIVASGPGFDQLFSSSMLRAGERATVRGRHWLGFAGEAREAFLCTSVCIESEASSPVCQALIDATAPVGDWLPPPPPSLLARSVLGAALHPEIAVLLLALVSALIGACLVARRPRPRPL